MNWFRNLRTSAKLLLTCGMLATLMGFVAWEGVSGMSDINHDLTATGEHAEGLSALMDADLDLLRISRAVRNAILDDDRVAVEKRQADIRKYDESFRTSFDRFRATVVLEASRKRADALVKGFDELRLEQDQVVALALEQKDGEAKSHLTAIRAKADALDEEMEGLRDSKLKLMTDARADGVATFATARTAVLIAIGVGLALATLIAMFVARLIGGPLRQAATVLGHVAAGDFTQRLAVDSRDEVGQMARALNSALEEIQRALLDVRTSAESVASASQQLSAASENIATGSQEQASSLEETAASLEEMTSTVKQNADNAQQASQLAGGARDVAEAGGETVSRAVAAMGEINEASTRIADIITTIDEIAFQTNLLALNAAVEAARAGEQGRGFAVVAAEVRNLAQRSASAAKEIKGLIQDSVRKVENGAQLVNESGRTLHEIVNAVKRVTDIIAEIAAASREQSTGIDQVNQAVSQMDQVTQGNAAQTEELSGTAQGLTTQAQQLQALVARFTLEVRPKGSAASAARPAGPPRRAPARNVLALPSRPKAATAPALVQAPTGTDGMPSAEHGFEEY